MYVRKKKNRSGSFSVVIVKKRSGVYKEIKTIGIGSDKSEVETLIRQGHLWIKEQSGHQDLFESYQHEKTTLEMVDNFFSYIENILLNGT